MFNTAGKRLYLQGSERKKSPAAADQKERQVRTYLLLPGPCRLPDLGGFAARRRADRLRRRRYRVRVAQDAEARRVTRRAGAAGGAENAGDGAWAQVSKEASHQEGRSPCPALGVWAHRGVDECS